MNSPSECIKQEQAFIFQYFSSFEHLKFCIYIAELSMKKV